MLLLILTAAHLTTSAGIRNCLELTDVGGVQPIQYNFDLTFSGLKDADRDSTGRFWVQGEGEIITRSLDTLCNLVLHAGQSEHIVVTKKVFKDDYRTFFKDNHQTIMNVETVECF